MKRNLTPLTLAISLLALTVPLPTWAGGKHAGGHGHHAAHGNQETPYGKPGQASQVSRTIAVTMDDTMRFTPASIQVQQGETVRLTVTNQGKLKHELSLGTEQELLDHLEEMKQFPDMEHDEPNKITLAPGKSGDIVWQFTQSGTVHFACLIPGHFEAGMKGTVDVAPAWAQGEVRKIDLANGKVTLRHGAIPNLKMPPMTMVFIAKDKDMLNALKLGDTVRFVVIHEAGKYVITQIQAAQ
jgi:uncharacterized cupredoxin-like copper-binding protein